VLKREAKDFAYAIYLKDEEEEEQIEGLYFPLDKLMAFRKAMALDGSPQTVFLWRDLRFGDNDLTEYEFVIPVETASEATVQLFHLTLAQSLYQVVHKRPAEGALESELMELVVDETAAKEESKAEGVIKGRVVYESDPVGFYVFDPASSLFVPREAAVLAVISEPPSRTGKESFEYELSIVKAEDKSIIHMQRIDPDATLHTDRASGSFVWCQYDPKGTVWTFSLRFGSAAALMAFSNAIGQAIYETLNKESFDKVEAEEARYLLNPFNDVEMADASEVGSASEEESEEEASGSGYEEDEEQPDSKEANAQLAVGYKHDRSFVSRGHEIGVFKHTDERLTFHTNIERVRTKRGELFTPSKMMLHEEDSALLLMNPNERSQIYKMDLERGAIVDEWTVHPDAPVTAIVPDSKYAQMTGQQTLIGLNDSAVFRIDPRLPGSKRVDTEMRSYAVKNRFSCGATTAKGELAVASEKGEIRLFDKIDKRAKTLLPGFGDPILGIDVTASGRLLVATCKTYLLLIDTEIDAGVLGFTKSMAAAKPAPKRLQLKPEHVAYMGGPVAFTPAKFSTGTGEEKAIITSTGPYVITWNLRRVKQGKLFDYQIRKYGDNVVADNFRFNQDRSIVVTLPHHVTMISQKTLAKPSSALLTSPTKAAAPRKSGGKVVESLY
jgi:hypothetical protein